MAPPVDIEWSQDALADLDRFAAFLQHEHPDLAGTVALEIIPRPKRFQPFRGWAVRLPEGQSIASLRCRCSMHPTCSNIGLTGSAW